MSIDAAWEWLSQNRETLAWLCGGAATGAGGIWAVVRYLLDHTDNSASKSKRGAPDKSQFKSVKGRGGVTVSDVVNIGGTIVFKQHQLPKSVVFVAALMLLAFVAMRHAEFSKLSPPMATADRRPSIELSPPEAEIPTPEPLGKSSPVHLHFGEVDELDPVKGRGTFR